MKAFLALVLTGLILAGCGQTIRERVVIRTAEVPDSLLRCVPPAQRNKPFIKVNEKQISYLLTRQTTSAYDCASKLEEVRQLIERQKRTLKLKPKR